MSVLDVHDDDGPGLMKMVSSLRRLKAGDWRDVVNDCNIPQPDADDVAGLASGADVYDKIARYLVSSIVHGWAFVAIRHATPRVAAGLRGLSEASKAALLAWFEGKR